MQILKNRFYFLILAFLCCLNVKAQSFVKVQGAATDIAISPKDGSVYVVGTSKNVFKYNFNSKRFAPFGPQTKDVARIAVSNLNQIFASKINASIECSNGSSSWTKLSAFSNDVATDNNGMLWVSMKNRGGDIQTYDNAWKRPLKAIVNVSKVAPVNQNTAWVIMNDKSIQKHENNRWNNMPGAALDIAVDTKTKEVYVIGTSKRIFKWNNTSKKWLPLAGTRTDFESLDAHDGKIWAVATDKSIYEYTTNQNSIQSNLNNANIDYSGIYRIHIIKLISTKGNDEFFGTAGVYLEANTKSGAVKINPQNNEANRYLDIPRNNISKVRRDKTIVDNITYDYSMKIDRKREFKLLGEAANESAVFDFQFNIKKYGLTGAGLFGDYGEWNRQKINVKDVEFGKNMYHTTTYYTIVFKIDKL